MKFIETVFVVAALIGCSIGSCRNQMAVADKKERIRAEAKAKDIARKSPEAQLIFWQEAMK